MEPVALADVTLLDGFWRERVEANRIAGIPALYERLVAHGVVDNFDAVCERRGLWFTDSDLYKWLEAAAASLATRPDDDLAALVESTAERIAAAQRPDGYLNTAFPPEKQFGDLTWTHECYCTGHLVQAAIELWRASGNRTLLDAAVRAADLLDTTFGPGRREDRDRHPVVEMALVELARVTDRDEYRRLARFFSDAVGSDEWSRLWGHAVCALYYACGLTDLALDGDDHLVDRLRLWWDDLVSTSSYVTGGVGGRWIGESFGRPYELPQEGAYAETCAAVASAQWAWRMLRLTGDTSIGDHLERVLHNAVLAGMSWRGDEWFYASALGSSAVEERHPFIGDDLPIRIAGPFPLRRLPWRDVTCCPPNVARTLATFGRYCCLAGPDELRLVLYTPSRVRAAGFDLEIDTDMPWGGRVVVRVHDAPPHDATISLRIPSWSRLPDAGTWRAERRRWRNGDLIELDLGVAVTMVEANPRVTDARGAVAVVRGPLVYCAEGVDNPGFDLRDVHVAPDVVVVEEWSDLFGGVIALAIPAHEIAWTGPAYRPVTTAPAGGRPCTLRLVPFHLWANRGVTPMRIWFSRSG